MKGWRDKEQCKGKTKSVFEDNKYNINLPEMQICVPKLYCSSKIEYVVNVLVFKPVPKMNNLTNSKEGRKSVCNLHLKLNESPCTSSYL